VPVYCNFLTKPKLKLTVKRPEKYPKGYPIKPKTLGEKIRKHHLDLSLFQKDVAKFVGVSADTVTYWERGRTQPGKENLKKIKEFLRLKKNR